MSHTCNLRLRASPPRSNRVSVPQWTPDTRPTARGSACCRSCPRTTFALNLFQSSLWYARASREAMTRVFPRPALLASLGIPLVATKLRLASGKSGEVVRSWKSTRYVVHGCWCCDESDVSLAWRLDGCQCQIERSRDVL